VLRTHSDLPHEVHSKPWGCAASDAGLRLHGAADGIKEEAQEVGVHTLVRRKHEVVGGVGRACKVQAIDMDEKKGDGGRGREDGREGGGEGGREGGGSTPMRVFPLQGVSNGQLGMLIVENRLRRAGR
jgi:hypothetical protein